MSDFYVFDRAYNTTSMDSMQGPLKEEEIASRVSEMILDGTNPGDIIVLKKIGTVKTNVEVQIDGE